jgi:hypothetical protein
MMLYHTGTGTPSDSIRRRQAVQAVAAFVILGTFLLVEQRSEAHKPITSKYTYNDDVFPILKERCARCHVQGGVAPMSLMTYEEAFPWAESIRAELVAGHMPPATADERFGEIAHARTLTPKEIDVLLTWATGGNPRGALDKTLPPVELKNDWPLGSPDLELPLPAEFTLPADKMEETREFTIPTTLTMPKWIRAVDLRPGTPAIVRSALIFVKGAPDQALARWLPGSDPQVPPQGTAFQLEPGAELVARIRYKKTWSYEGKALTDRSTVGVYFDKLASASPVKSVMVDSADIPATRGQTFTFRRTLEQGANGLAISPDRVPDNVTLQVEAVRPDGTRTPLVRFTTQPDWMRRYWFAQPVGLPKGTNIEVRGTVEDPDLVAAAFGGPASSQKAAAATRISLALDVVSIDRP